MSNSIKDSKAIVIVKDEKDAEALKKIGLVSTYIPESAGTWNPKYNDYFKDKFIAIFYPQNNGAIKTHANKIAESLYGVGMVRILKLPGLSMSDFISRGGTKSKLIEIIKAGSLWEPSKEETGPQPEVSTSTEKESKDTTEKAAKNTNFDKGAFVLSRSLFESDIWFMEPGYLKIWIYLIGKANHTGKKYKGFYCERGQYFTDYAELREQLEYSIGYRKVKINENFMKNLMKFLRSTGRITTTKKPRGLLISICNYGEYQDLKNYEKSNEKTIEKTTKKPEASIH